MLPFAVLLGIASGYFGGRFDMLVQRIVDAVLSFPYLVFLLALVAVFQPGLWTIILALAFLSIWGSSRIIRGAAMSVKHDQFVDAAKSIGAGDMRILLRHVLPNVFAPIIVIATINVGGFILAEASISFLGFGVPPPTPTWGGMLSGAGLYYMYDAPWLSLWPGIFLSLTVFGFNMLGDAMRDLLDPRLRRA
jgi:peptide/nickel transport system permease protein